MFQHSYISKEEFLSFLVSYSDHFNLRKHIKFNTLVQDVRLYNEEQWKITTLDKTSNKKTTDIYDAVFVCNGHYSEPKLPKIEGIEHFSGKILHSRDYRKPEIFKDKRVLVIGAGPSGIDITMDLSTEAALIGISHHKNFKLFDKVFAIGVKQYPDVRKVLPDGSVEFIDEDVNNFDVILYCTGYHYCFPFLHESCGITVKNNNYVEPLYKHCININIPTMFFIGLNQITICSYMTDIQARYCLKMLTEGNYLPPKYAMMTDLKRDLEERKKRRCRDDKLHDLGPDFLEIYLNSLADEVGLEPFPEVLSKMTKRVFYLLFNEYYHFRDFSYVIKSPTEFEEIKIK